MITAESTSPNQRSLSHYTGCLLGGAVGDALGAPVQFIYHLDGIHAFFGNTGIRDFKPAFGTVGAITQNTQLALFTADGLLKADNRLRARGISPISEMVRRSYRGWARTQNATPAEPVDPRETASWLFQFSKLWERRNPSEDALAAICKKEIGNPTVPINQSVDSCALARMAPVGFMRQDSFRYGVELGALTHGHPNGYLPAGFFAELISRILAGNSLETSIDGAIQLLEESEGHADSLAAVRKAVEAAKKLPPLSESLAHLGKGWEAHEELAIALFCALGAKTFEDGVILAVNHGGNSTATGTVTGNILGALFGEDAIPKRWLGSLEFGPEIRTLAVDLHSHFSGVEFTPSEQDTERYPFR